MTVLRTIAGSALIAVLTFLLAGCGGSATVEKTTSAAPVLSSSLRLATLNFAGFKRRLEKKDVAALAKVLKREQIDVVAVHGITRYPDVATRVDFVRELSAQTDMRNVFGEMVNNSGRQTGNAIFSSYPILSHHNQSFDAVKSAVYEAALAATVDEGSGSVVVVSAEFPDRSTKDDDARCAKIIAGLNPDAGRSAMVVTGNLPDEAARTQAGFSDATALLPGKHPADVSVWYAGSELFRPVAARVVPTDMGPLLITQFGLYRTPSSTSP